MKFKIIKEYGSLYTVYGPGLIGGVSFADKSDAIACRDACVRVLSFEKDRNVS